MPIKLPRCEILINPPVSSRHDVIFTWKKRKLDYHGLNSWYTCNDNPVSFINLFINPNLAIDISSVNNLSVSAHWTPKHARPQ